MKNLSSLLLLVAISMFVFAGRVAGQNCDCGSDTEAPTIVLKKNLKWIFQPTYSPNTAVDFSVDGNVITLAFCNGSSGYVSLFSEPEENFFSKLDVETTDNCDDSVRVEVEFIDFIKENPSGSRNLYRALGRQCYSTILPKVKYIAQDKCGNKSELTFQLKTRERLLPTFYPALAKIFKVDSVSNGGTYSLDSLSQTDTIFQLPQYERGCNTSTIRTKGLSEIDEQKATAAADCDMYELLLIACFDTTGGGQNKCNCPTGNPDSTIFFIKVGDGCDDPPTDCPDRQTIELPTGTTAAPIHWQLPIALIACDTPLPPCDQTPLNSFQSLGKRGSSLYYFSNFRKNWSDAQAICLSKGGTLAVVTDAAENKFITQAIGKQESVWLGLSDQNQEGNFEWADGTPLGYSNWAAGQPDNAGSFAENFTLLEPWLGDGQWTDQNRWVEKPFVLEIPCPGAAVGIVQTLGPASGSLLGAGVYPVTYTLTDSCGNVSNCQFEVEVVAAGGGTACPLVNHALQKNANQSSTWFGAFGSRAVDGNVNGNFWQDFSVAHTAWETNPWWQVDLGERRDIRQVNIWGRTDCCSAETSGFYVLISENALPQPGNLNDLLADPTVKKYFVADPADRPTTVPTAGATGRFVRLQAAKATFLGLAEVEVLGCEKITNSSDAPDRRLQAGQKIEETPDETLSDFELMPNPTADFVDVFLKKYVGKSGELVVFNQLGLLVLSRRFENLGEEKMRLPLRDLGFRNGQYFVGVRESGLRPVFRRLVFLNEN